MLSLITLYESAPDNPNTIIIQNEFYSKSNSLTQNDIYNYYLNNKQNILNEVNNRELIFFLATDINNFIVKRKIKNNFIKLTSSNYENIINGRTVSIHSTMNQYENFGIIDIDYHDFEVAKNVVIDLYDYLYKINKNLRIRFTGKDSFHLLYYFDKKYNISEIKNILYNLIKDFADKYDIKSKRSGIKPNLDLSSNKIKGGFISLYSLSILGLRCMEIDRKRMLQFDKNEAKIKI